jgi:hypothetical protein
MDEEPTSASDVTPHASTRLAKVYPVQVRLDRYERERLEAIAAAWGVNLSVSLRQLIREAKLNAS